MKSIGSRGTTGSEAILVVSILWWIDRYKIYEYINKLSRRIDPNDFSSKRDSDLGMALYKYIDLDKIILNFWNSAYSDPSVKFMIEKAVISMKEGDLQENIDKAKTFVKKSIISKFGAMIKNTFNH